MSAPFVLTRLPETDEDLWWTVKLLWNVEIPREQICDDHVAPFTAFADAYFRRNSLTPESGIDSLALWIGSRGLSGKSFMLSILGLTVTCLLGSDVNLLGGSLAQSTNIHEHMRHALDFERAPRYMIVSESNTETKFTNKAKIRPLTASQKTVRGPHPATLLLDEIDEMELKIMDAALGQPLPQANYLGQILDPYTVACSTHQNPDGPVTEMLKRARKRGIPVYRWCYRESHSRGRGWLTKKAINEKRASIPDEMWRVEYDLGEPSIGNRAVNSAAVEAMFSWDVEPVLRKVQKDYWEYMFEDFQPGARYVVTADWAQTQDYTVIQVSRIDTYPRRVVYWMRVNRRPYPQMIGYFNKAIKRYQVRDALHDSQGLGGVVKDYVDVRARPFSMVGVERSKMLSNCVNAIEKGAWLAPRVLNIFHDEVLYCRVEDLYSNKQEYHLPDSFCALGLGEHLASRSYPVPTIELIPRDETPTALEREFLSERQGGIEGNPTKVISTAPISFLVG